MHERRSQEIPRFLCMASPSTSTSFIAESCTVGRLVGKKYVFGVSFKDETFRKLRFRFKVGAPNNSCGCYSVTFSLVGHLIYFDWCVVSQRYSGTLNMLISVR